MMKGTHIVAKKEKTPSKSKKDAKPAKIPGDAKGKPSKKLQKILDEAKASVAAKQAAKEAHDAAEAAKEAKAESKLKLDGGELKLGGKKGKKAKKAADDDAALLAVAEARVAADDGTRTSLDEVIAETGGKKSKKGKAQLKVDPVSGAGFIVEEEAPKGKKGKKSGKAAGADSAPDSTDDDAEAAAADLIAGKKPKKPKGGGKVPDSNPFESFTRNSAMKVATEKAWREAVSTGKPVQFTLDKPIVTKNYGEKMAAPFAAVGVDIEADQGTFVETDKPGGAFLYGFTVRPPQD